MSKSLIFVLPFLLLTAPTMAADAQTPHGAALQSGRSAGPDDREAWMRKAVGDILEGRVADSAPQTPSAQPR